MNEPTRFESSQARFLRVIRGSAWVSLLSAVVAVAAVSWGGPLRVHMVIATFLGVFFTVMMAAALMSLAYFSNNSGHDEDATGKPPRD